MFLVSVSVFGVFAALLPPEFGLSGLNAPSCDEELG